MAVGRSYLLFDIDFTLLRTDGAARAAFTRAFEALTGVPDAIDGINFAGRTDRGVLVEAARRAGMEPPQGFASCYVEMLRQELRVRETHVLPGVVSLLDSLRERPDVVLGLGTGNLRETAFLKLAAAGLDGYFSTGGFGERHEHREGMLRDAMEAVGWSEGERLVVIGDSIHDVEGALAVGARCVAVATGFASSADLATAGADVVLPDLADAALVEAALFGH